MTLPTNGEAHRVNTAYIIHRDHLHPHLISRSDLEQNIKTVVNISGVCHHKDRLSPHYFSPKTSLLLLLLKEQTPTASVTLQSTKQHSSSDEPSITNMITHLVPGNVRLFARLNVIIDVGTEDVFALAELSLLTSSHVGVVAHVGVVLRHGQRHGDLHAVCGVPVGGGAATRGHKGPLLLISYATLRCK